MLLTTLVLLPLALARPHLRAVNDRRSPHAALVDRAGAAYDNETQQEYSAWRHTHDLPAQTTSSPAASAATGSVAGVGQALSAVNTPSSASPAQSAEPSDQEEQESAQPATTPTVVETVTSAQEQQAETSAAAAVAVSPSPESSSAVESSAVVSSSSSTPSSVTHHTTVTASRSSTVVRVTASASASATAASANEEPEKIAGLNKTTFIIIIVVAGVVALAAVGWTVFRKWKLRPSRRFDDKMRPIDFSPQGAGAYSDDMEKPSRTHQRMSSAALHRQELVNELEHDSKHVEGVPDHDFTAGGGIAGGVGAGMAGAGAGAYDMYNHDPYAHAEAYEYDAAYQYHDYDQPTQDPNTVAGGASGYADLQRGNSIGSGSGHGHGHGHGQQYPVENFPMPDHYLNRAQDGPYGRY